MLLCGPLVAGAASGGSTLDEGKLEVGWFAAGATFNEDDEIDYLWVKDGFDLAGQSLQFAPWGDPKFLGKKAGERDEKDRRLAATMNNDMQMLFGDAFGGAGFKVVKGGGALRVEGRIVDCSTGSTAAKIFVGMGAGSGNTTIDVRFIDVKSGAAVAGFHHRVVSGSSWSTTESKFGKWVDEVAERIAKKGLAKLYAKGDKVKE
jgi:hypothetical protein